ncbi:MAG: FmdB family zinc ribbon protein [Syntrophomonadaceae bacterium]|jgi:putative FmdB family regulatory protein|nr:zinc ribbon domain-containing protein [Bacillota bacterium]NLM88325.1 transcriptional regulator [Syntrophomonadaceae bacterium]HAA09602.1 transcriptional regulator [Syntrophomonas sp.]HQA49428.1 zinc ribbon domain-containing protein [Syntrophomonadaceae bacterium]HQD90067.1 zinc ribbon domain-containing protein [Syntrophomonadaceae bacterium]
MPIYEYKCSNCGIFEKMQRINEASLTQCPTCGEQVHRVISKNVGIVFKGSGFYTTDSGNRLKDQARALNQERQKDNEALLDGDIKGFVEQSESTDKKVAGA